MRKSKREVTDLKEICGIIDRCDTIRLGFCDGDEAYIVPLSFGWEEKDGALVFYVHGAKEGRRHELARSAKRCCVEADILNRYVELESGDQTADYESFIGTGSIEEISGDEAVHGLELLCRHCGFEKMGCTQAVVGITCVEKIVVREFSAKRRFKPSER